MLNEKHNDRYGWKNKLGGLTGLQGEAALDKDAAWEKLHSRLQEKPVKKKAVWYWAAACLLAALIIPLMMTNKKEHIVVKQDLPQKQQPVTVTIPPAAPVIVEAPKPAEKKKVENNSLKDQHIKVINNTVKNEEPVNAIAETNIEKEPAVTITDTATVLATTIPVKKKMAVVHINELRSPTTQFYNQPNYVQRSFKIKFKNGKAANQTVATQQYEGGFKINLSPKN